MKVALVHCPAIRSLEGLGGPELILPPIGICSLAAYLKRHGYEPDLFDLLLEFDTTVISDALRDVLPDLFEAARSDRAYEPAVMTDLGFYLGLNRNYLFREVVRLEQDLLHGEREREDAASRPVRQFFRSRARDLARYDVVGLSVILDEQEVAALVLARCIRMVSPRTRIVVGGTGAHPERWLRLADVIVRGEGERELLAFVSGHPVSEPSNAPALARATPVQYLARLDDLPTPDYADLFRKYRYLTPVRVVPLAVTRGCYWGRCLFCAFGWRDERTGRCTAPYRKMSPRRVLEDIERQAEENGTRTFFFSVDVADQPFLERLCDALRGLRVPISWSTGARAEGQFLKRGFLRTLAKAGCRAFSCGYESFNQRVLDSMHKGTRSGEARRLLEGLRREGIFTNIGCFIGFPGETPKEAAETHAVLSAFYRNVPGHVADRFQLVEDSPAARLGSARTWAPLRYVGSRQGWVKQGMSWDAQDRQWLILATNFYCDSRSSCFPMRSDGGYALLYASRYSLPELARMFRDEDRSFGLLGSGRLTFYGFFHAHHYCDEIGARFDHARFLSCLRALPAPVPHRSRGRLSKRQRLESAYDLVRAFVLARDLGSSDREFLMEVARFDFGLLLSTLRIGRLPLVHVDDRGNLARPGNGRSPALDLDFSIDVEAVARFERRDRIATDLKTRVRFDLHGFRVLERGCPGPCRPDADPG